MALTLLLMEMIIPECTTFEIAEAAEINVITGVLISEVMRGLQVTIEKLMVGLKVCVCFAFK